MSTGFIYPQLERAKESLSKEIARAIALGKENHIYGLIDDWFKRHVFEFTSATDFVLNKGSDARSLLRDFASVALAAVEKIAGG